MKFKGQNIIFLNKVFSRMFLFLDIDLGEIVLLNVIKLYMPKQAFNSYLFTAKHISMFCGKMINYQCMHQFA